MIKIDPVCLKGLKDLPIKLSKATIESGKETAILLNKKVDHNLRTGYNEVVKGLGSKWDPISDMRYHILETANLLPHEGLVAETEKLVSSVKLTKVANDGFKVSVGSAYAETHEFGGGRAKVPPRPYFYPAINHLKAEKSHEKIIKNNIAEVIKESQK